MHLKTHARIEENPEDDSAMTVKGRQMKLKIRFLDLETRFGSSCEMLGSQEQFSGIVAIEFEEHSQHIN